MSVDAQTNENILSFNEIRLERQKTGMWVLGAWALGNIGAGIALSSQRDGSAKYFHQMNAGWNLVNLGIASVGYLAAVRTDPAAGGLYESIQSQYQIQKILLLNTGLDVAYMAGGAYLIERSKNDLKNPDRLKGFGQSILLQGGFLFVFDLAQYAWLASSNETLKTLLGSMGPTPDGIGLTLRF
ncbi:MAG: DUF6992 family protein [Haliscomenobacter sp.]